MTQVNSTFQLFAVALTTMVVQLKNYTLQCT